MDVSWSCGESGTPAIHDQFTTGPPDSNNRHKVPFKHVNMITGYDKTKKQRRPYLLRYDTTPHPGTAALLKRVRVSWRRFMLREGPPSVRFASSKGFSTASSPRRCTVHCLTALPAEEVGQHQCRPAMLLKQLATMY